MLNFMAIPNIVIFICWQFQMYWGPLAGHTTMSLANISRGRVWVVLAAPFSHRNFGEAMRSAFLLVNTLDSFDRSGSYWAVYLWLYIGGCFASWVARGIILRYFVIRESGAFYTQEQGASGGFAALLLFLARARPTDRYQFSMYFVPLPLNLRAWHSLLAHGALDVMLSKHGWRSELIAHLAAWTFGWVAYSAWLKHA